MNHPNNNLPQVMTSIKLHHKLDKGDNKLNLQVLAREFPMEGYNSQHHNCKLKQLDRELYQNWEE